MAKFFSTLDALTEKVLDTIAARLYAFNGSTWDRICSTGGDNKSLLVCGGINGNVNDNMWDRVIYPFNSVGDNRYGYIIYPMFYNGVKWDRARTPCVFKSFDAVAIAAETTIWTPAAGKKFRVMGYNLVSSVAGNILLRDNTAGTIIAVIPSAAGGSAPQANLGNGILSAAANNVLTAIGPASSTLSGMVWGTEE